MTLAGALGFHMLSEQKLLALRSFLGILPGGSATQLARMIEIDRLNDGTLPHDAILEFLRPALRQYNNRVRVPSPIRYFCFPFEDLLFNGPRVVKRQAAIARAVIQPLWHWLERDLLVPEMAEYMASFKAAVACEDTETCDALAVDFWRLSGHAIGEALNVDGALPAAFVNDAALVEDAREIATLLIGGQLVSEVRTLFPKPAPVPNEEKMTAFKAIHNAAADTMPALVPYLPVVAMGRLEKPWQALRLVGRVTNRRTETMLAATDMGLAGELLFGRMEDALSVIRGMTQTDFDPDTLIDNLTEFTLLSGAIPKEIDILRSGAWGKRLLANRATISAIMEGYMERALQDIAAAIPLKSSSVGAQTLVPHFGKVIADKNISRACRYAKLLAGCRYLAGPAAFVVKYNEASNASVDMLCFYNEAILNELRYPQWPDRVQVERQFTTAMEISRHLLGAEEASLLHRRGTIARETAEA